jgi:hypothetical protein
MSRGTPVEKPWSGQFINVLYLEIRVFCYVAPCSLVGIDRRSRVAYCLHRQGDDSSYTHFQ